MTEPDEQRAWEVLEHRLRMILPEQYQEAGEVLPVSMGSAGLKFDGEGRVAWNEIWGSFCDLAMAGGPPHKGRLLAPGSTAEIAAQPERYRAVLGEIARGIVLVSSLSVEPHATPGWIRVHCGRSAAAGWLARAITMENVAVRVQGALLDLPVGPGWRLEKEIKNVVTVVAKTCHYWAGHTRPRQQGIIADLFASMAAEAPLLQPGYLEGSDAMAGYQGIAAAMREHTGLLAEGPQYTGWMGLACADPASTIWRMRALVAGNILSRREETTLFVPIHAASDPGGERVISGMRHVERMLRLQRRG